MNKVKEMLSSITKQAWIISGASVLIIIILSLTVWPFSIFKKEVATEEVKVTENAEEKSESKDAFNAENVAKGEYKNDVSSATTYVQYTEEVKVAVVVGEAAQKIVGDTLKVSCGQIAFTTTRVAGPTVLTNSLKALFENKITTDFLPGNIIPSYHPKLTLEKVLIENGVAKIYLGGNFDGEKEGLCGASLAIAQITETAKTFESVSSVEIYQGDKKIN